MLAADIGPHSTPTSPTKWKIPTVIGWRFVVFNIKKGNMKSPHVQRNAIIATAATAGADTDSKVIQRHVRIRLWEKLCLYNVISRD